MRIDKDSRIIVKNDKTYSPTSKNFSFMDVYEKALEEMGKNHHNNRRHYPMMASLQANPGTLVSTGLDHMQVRKAGTNLGVESKYLDPSECKEQLEAPSIFDLFDKSKKDDIGFSGTQSPLLGAFMELKAVMDLGDFDSDQNENQIDLVSKIISDYGII